MPKNHHNTKKSSCDCNHVKYIKNKNVCPSCTSLVKSPYPMVIEIPLAEMNHDELMKIAVLAKIIMGNKWKRIYFDILTNIINHSQKEFYELSKLKKAGPSWEHGFLLIHCDLGVIISDLIDGYKHGLSMVRWRTFDHPHNNGILSKYISNIKKLYDEDTYCVLIAIEDNFDDNDTFVKQIVLSDCDNNGPVLGYESILNTICDFRGRINKNVPKPINQDVPKPSNQDVPKPINQNVPKPISIKQNKESKESKEKDSIFEKIKILKEETHRIYDYERTYKYLSDILLNEIESLFDDNIKKCFITLVTTNDDVFKYTLFRMNGKYMYSLPDHGNRIVGDNKSVSRYVHRYLENSFAMTIRLIGYNGPDKICHFSCLYSKRSIILKKIKPEISEESMNTDSYSGKKILGVSNEEYI